MNNLKNTNLEVSSFALGCVEKVVDNTNIDNEEYKTLSKKMSALIQKNGLINTVVFCYSKNDKKHFNEILKNMINWAKTNFKISSYFNNLNENKINDYLLQITKLSTKDYRLVTREMMIFFGWIKRFADGMIVKKEKKQGDINEDLQS